MIMKLTKNKAISELQEEFNTAYPFLRISFYKPSREKKSAPVRQKLNHAMILAKAGLSGEGEIAVTETTTVKQLEQDFLGRFGLFMQVSRRSGSIWLETTMSDDWTLKQQNDHGRELSESVKYNPEPDEFDYE